MLKLGIAGTGTIAKEVLPVVGECGWEATAICSTPRSQKVAEELCREYGIAKAYYDYTAMLTQEKLDAVYLAIPNHLHYKMAKEALLAGHNVILEKPLTDNMDHAREIAALAREKQLFLFEAITTLYQPNYTQVKHILPRIGEVKLVSCNFSQYSRRYDAFVRGEILPVFDPKKSGGALMDINVYNLHYVIGLFGMPQKAFYCANMDRGIDTSGVLTLQYEGFCAVCMGAKDSAAPSGCVIQGVRGYICQEGATNVCGPVSLRLRDGLFEEFDENPENRLSSEFKDFARQIASGDTKMCYRTLEHSLALLDILLGARENCGL